MSIDNYTNLKTAIANYFDDGELGDRIPEFISMAEGRINRKLRGLQQQVIATAIFGPSSSRYIAAPSGYLEMIDLAIKKSSDNDSEYRTVKYTPPERLLDYYNISGSPAWFTYRNQLEFNIAPEVEYTLRMHFLKKWDIATDATNWILTNYPDVYLYGSLIEAATLRDEEQRMPRWEKRFNDSIDEINELEERTRDDGEMDISELTSMSSSQAHYSIVNDR